MIGAVIRSGKNTLVVELPTGVMDLQTKLSSVGIDRTAENINLSDEDGDRIRVKLYATEPEEVHLLSLLTPDRTLADANSSMMLLQRANQNSLPRLKCCLLGDNYRSLEDFINDAKQVFTRERTVDSCAQAMQRFEEDPNIRAVVSCVHDNEIEMLLLPLSDRQLKAENVRLEELGASCTLKIEALRYGKPWQDIFADVLDNEGLAAVNALAAAFPYMEEAQKLAAVVEYADAYDSRSVIKLAEHLDDFEFYPGCSDTADVAREWLSNQPHLQLSAELEEYFDFDAYGSDLQDEFRGEFVSSGYVFMPEGHQLEDILDDDDNILTALPL